MELTTAEEIERYIRMEMERLVLSRRALLFLDGEDEPPAGVYRVDDGDVRDGRPLQAVAGILPHGEPDEHDIVGARRCRDIVRLPLRKTRLSRTGISWGLHPQRKEILHRKSDGRGGNP